VVTAPGPAATVFAVGDRVLGAGDVIRAGGWAERVVVDHHRGDLAAPAPRRRQPATNPRPWGAGRLRPSATMTLHGLTPENHEDGPRLAESATCVVVDGTLIPISARWRRTHPAVGCR